MVQNHFFSLGISIESNVARLTPIRKTNLQLLAEYLQTGRIEHQEVALWMSALHREKHSQHSLTPPLSPLQNQPQYYLGNKNNMQTSSRAKLGKTTHWWCTQCKCHFPCTTWVPAELSSSQLWREHPPVQLCHCRGELRHWSRADHWCRREKRWRWQEIEILAWWSNVW